MATSGILLALFSATASFAQTYVVPDGQAVETLGTFRECEACPEMIVMPPGSFMMGAVEGEARNPFDLYGPDATMGVREPEEINVIPHEHPRHRVKIDIPFAMGRGEIKHSEWMACVGAGGCGHVPNHRVLSSGDYVSLGPDHPVVNVSYLDAQEYVAWLNSITGTEAYRLPTEAEWEYAARAGTQTRFPFGDDVTAQQANFSRAATEHLRRQGRHEFAMPELTNRRMPVEVDALDAANPWGLRHILGNINETTMSCWSDAHLGLPTSSAYLAHARANGPCRRVSKGGGYGTAMDGLRPAHRTRPTEDRRRDYRGFRVLRELPTSLGSD